MRVVVAPDKFKGSLTAAEVAAAVAAGLRDVRPELDVVQLPVADGGDGTVAAALGAGYSRVEVTAVGPTGMPVLTGYARQDDRAVVELADVVGLAQLPDGLPDPLRASTFGLGIVMCEAIDSGVSEIVLGLGGSASTDGGAGLAQALGAVLTDGDGRELPYGGAALTELRQVDLSGLRARLEGVRVVVACDVDNPLLGPYGAAAVFGPQKGASAADVVRLEEGLRTWSRVVAEAFGTDLSDQPGAGAAGGAGFAALALLGAELRPGIELVLDLVGFEAAVRGADLVITGEGSLDEQSLAGKAPVGVAQAAARVGSPVVAVAGRNLLAPDRLAAVGIARAYPLTELEPHVSVSMVQAASLLRRVGATIATEWLPVAAVRRPSDNRPADDRPADNRPADNTKGVTATPGQHYDLLVRGRRILSAHGEAPGQVAIHGAVIAAIEPLGAPLTADVVVELADDEVLLPGLVDSHVHVNEPGRTEWEGFASATRAAAAGGVTTIVDMPLNSIPPTCTVDALHVKQQVAQDQAFVDVGFWGGAIPGNASDLRPLHEEGVFGFKCFLLHSGVDEFPPVTAQEMAADLAVLQQFDSLMVVHAEDAQTIDDAPPPRGSDYAGFLASRPRQAENRAVADVIAAARRTGARAHILHLSSADALPLIRDAKRDGVRLTVETCPHYLTLAAEDIPDGATAYKCCPPIREVANRDLLWEGLRDGTIDCIVSDHSPSTPDLKDLENGDFGVAWGGISSLQLGLSLIWTEARARGVELGRVVEWMSTRPAQLLGLPTKGRLAVGYQADLAVFAPDRTYVVDPARLHHKNPVTPYAQRQLTGMVRRTFLRGREIDGREPTGQLLRRE